jgi:hypothetical protein
MKRAITKVASSTIRSIADVIVGKHSVVQILAQSGHIGFASALSQVLTSAIQARDTTYM